MALQKVDAVIVGSGAGGSVVAKELTAAGLQVVVLERGPHIRTQDFVHDILHSQYNTTWGVGFGPDRKKDPRTFRLDDTQEARLIEPNDWRYGRTAACVGGGITSYGCMAWRFMAEDFKMKTLYGTPPNTTIEDWPITYDDLEPYYEKAEYELGISGKAGADPFASPRKKDYPLPPMPYDRAAQVFMRGARKLDLHPFPLPVAILSQAYKGRPACVRCLYCERFGCEVEAKSTVLVTVLKEALESGRCELRANSIAREVTLDARGRARSVLYFRPDGRLEEQPADLIVVSCSATETPRLLLNSASRLFPNGLANSSDQVGRNISAHPGGAAAFGYFEEEIFEPAGPGFSVALCDYCHRKGAVLGGGMISNISYIRHPLPFAKRIGHLGRHAWGRRAKAFTRDYFRGGLGVYSPGQGIPVESNRVDLDPKVRDAWGIRVVRLTHKSHPLDVRSSHFLFNRLLEILRAAGAVEEFLPQSIDAEETEKTVKNITTSSVGEHQFGTCRMGNDPKTSVVNRYCQSHDVDNLFVVDASTLVTIGGFNPSLTVEAIGFWASDYIKKQWATGAFVT